MKSICDHAKIKNEEIIGCDVDLSIIGNLIEEIIKNNAGFLPLETLKPKRRPKRFVSQIMSAAGGFVVGVAGASIYNKIKNENMNEMIQKAQDDQRHMMGLLQNQTTIVEGVNNVLRNQKMLIDKQMAQAFYNLDLLKQYLEKDEEAISLVILNQKFNVLFRHLIIAVLHFQNIQEKIKDIVLNNGEKEIVITDEQFSSEFNKIKKWMPKEQMLPRFRLLSEIYKISKKNVQISKQLLVINIGIPLIAVKKLELWEAVAWPFILNNKMFVIENGNKEMFVDTLLNQSFVGDLKSKECQHINDKNFICNHLKLVESERLSCEENLYFFNRSDGCVIKEIPKIEKWVKIANNAWIFSLPHSNNITILR